MADSWQETVLTHTHTQHTRQRHWVTVIYLPVACHCRSRAFVTTRFVIVPPLKGHGVRPLVNGVSRLGLRFAFALMPSPWDTARPGSSHNHNKVQYFHFECMIFFGGFNDIINVTGGWIHSDQWLWIAHIRVCVGCRCAKAVDKLTEMVFRDLCDG